MIRNLFVNGYERNCTEQFNIFLIDIKTYKYVHLFVNLTYKKAMENREKSLKLGKSKKTQEENYIFCGKYEKS